VSSFKKALFHFTAMSNRYLIVVPTPDCYRKSPNVFVIGEFLLTGWLRGLAAAGPRITLSGEVTADISGKLADALEQIETTPQDVLHDALCGDPGGGKDAFCAFLRGGGFRLVDGAVTTPEDLV
jgi:hypothetical protein